MSMIRQSESECGWDHDNDSWGRAGRAEREMEIPTRIHESCHERMDRQEL